MTFVIRVRNIILSAILTVVFCVLMLVLIIPLMAEVKFDAAEKYVKSFRWNAADLCFRDAIKYDSFSSKYAAAYAKFLRISAKNSYDRVILLNKAAEYYSKAIELEPRNAGNYAARAIVRLELKKPVDEAFLDFREALKNDPNGFNVAYYTGNYGVIIWSELSDGDKAMVTDRLKYICRIKPGLCKEVYLRAWLSSKDFALLQKITPENFTAQKKLYDFLIQNNLWEFRKEQAAIVNEYDVRENKTDTWAKIANIKKLFTESRKLAKANIWKKVDGKWQTGKRVEATLEANRAAIERQHKGMVAAEDWMSVSRDGKKIIKSSGVLNSSGTLYALVDIVDGAYSLKLEAKGAALTGIWPYATVTLDGENIGEILVDSAELKPFTFNLNATAGTKLLEVSFINPDVSTDKKYRRLLMLGSASLEKAQ